MWNPEARDSSPLIFTFMSSWETPPLPGRRGTRRSLWKRAAAGLDELVLEPWVSLWSNRSGEESTPPLAGREGTRCRRRAAWKEGNKGYQSDQIHCGGGARSVLGEYAKLRRLP